MEKIKNIVFDLGNVIVKSVTDEDLEKHFTNSKFLRQKIFQSEEWKKLDLGLIKKEDAVESLKTKYKEKDLIENAMNNYIYYIKENKEIFKIIKQLSNKYNLYILSNIHEEAYKYIDSKLNLKKYFKGITLSYIEHLMKPDKRIYEKLIKKYKLDPKETLYIDDKKENIISSPFIGFTIKKNSTKDLINILKNQGITLK